MDEQEAVLGRVGSVFGDILGQDPYGGDTGGSYVFVDLAHLDAVTNQWSTERDKISKRNRAIMNAIKLAREPAYDQMSRGQVEAFRTALSKLQMYNQTLLDYAANYVENLERTRAKYAETDAANQLHMTKLRSED